MLPRLRSEEWLVERARSEDRESREEQKDLTELKETEPEEQVVEMKQLK